ncbi:hypothetical protein BN946_scf184778.g3 [Trametes cinnabarina]|uniref:Uncharacterized protein n=1 Tax=Pycnoporus cinnabarinus TaxID=5643 RepID=A0A060S5I2_PYCCI|nr:hypothetical protein BN946_scf184778.g3 [Trametes cinnabarina]
MGASLRLSVPPSPVPRPPFLVPLDPGLTSVMQSKLINWLATDCDADNNAHGGLCVATDQRWYVQVQHS